MPIVAYRNTDYGELAIALACTLRLLLTGIGGERSGAGLTMVAAAGSMAGASLRKNNTATTITKLTPTTIPYLASLGIGTTPWTEQRGGTLLSPLTAADDACVPKKKTISLSRTWKI
jgi:hypothetical protein